MSRPLRVWRLEVEPSPPPTPTQVASWEEWCADNGWYDEFGTLDRLYPVPNRRHWLTKATAEKKAVWLRRWGYEVSIVGSEPVVWKTP